MLSALMLQSSKLQDTRMLTEFLEHLELDESQELIGGQYNPDQVLHIEYDHVFLSNIHVIKHLHFSCVLQPLHSDISSVPTLLGLQSSGVGDNQIETMGDPVEELREAVEMLNDTVRERGRSQSHDHAIQELLSKVRFKKFKYC